MKYKIALLSFTFFSLSHVCFSPSASAQDGSLDLSFDSDGKVTTDFGDIDGGYDVVLQPDGKIIVAGTGAAGGAFALARYNSNGSLDNTFDGDGKQSTIFGGKGDYGHSLALQSDGKIVVAGYTTILGLRQNFALARYNTNGSLDNTFGTGGKVSDSAGYENSAYATAIQSDGKIVVAGTSSSYSSTVGDYYRFVLLRYNTNGTLDNTFDGDGRVLCDSGKNRDAFALAIQADGKMIVAGTIDSNFALYRYNSNGSLDNTFGVSGKVITDIAITSLDIIYSLALQSDGKIIACGTTYNSSTNSDIALIRYNTNGSVDNTFGTAGKVITSVAAFDEGTSLAILSNGKMIVAGAADDKFAVLRYNSNGSLDNTFDTDGKVSTAIGTSAAGTSVAIQSDDKIVVAGVSDDDFAIARYNNSTLGIANLSLASAQDFHVAPNPFSYATQLSFEGDMLHDANITVYNALGVKVKELDHISGSSVYFYRDTLPNGTYFMVVKQDNEIRGIQKLTIAD